MTFKFNNEREAHEYYTKQAEEKAQVISIKIEVTHEQQVDIEEYCRKSGLTLTQYFVKLHNERKISESPVLHREIEEEPLKKKDTSKKK